MTLVDDTCDDCGGRFDPMGDPLLTKHPEIGPYAVFCATCEDAATAPDPQPPAAPETDVSAWVEASDWWCAEADEPRQVPCCTACVQSLSALLNEFYNSDDGDYVSALGDIHKHVALRLSAARERVREVEGERDAARREERMRAEDHARAWREVAAAEARAESAEAAHEALRAGVEALCATWERDDEESLNRFGQHLMGGSVLSCAEHLRALLAGNAR